MDVTEGLVWAKALRAHVTSEIEKLELGERLVFEVDPEGVRTDVSIEAAATLRARIVQLDRMIAACGGKPPLTVVR